MVELYRVVHFSSGLNRSNNEAWQKSQEKGYGGQRKSGEICGILISLVK